MVVVFGASHAKKVARCLSHAVGLFLSQLPTEHVGRSVHGSGESFDLALIWRPASFSFKVAEIAKAPSSNDKAMFGMTRFVLPWAWRSHLD